ncbi:hypothetical protein [Helicobacter cetorum]|uniref:Uncharacterized protein n=1 Tax=Helicobacter cetorum (strain ATCC BAA-429 / MIT 00-7128) TaxID=182217 RepID=I0EKU1_HELC0|nr:hypothetical protein [Helicobacter cetorum]AFI03560.1 hypothetical protein HCW_01355 [Helicobacter cetorum MIT 00-7128]
MDKKFIVSLALASSLISVASATNNAQDFNKPFLKPFKISWPTAQQNFNGFKSVVPTKEVKVLNQQLNTFKTLVKKVGTLQNQNASLKEINNTIAQAKTAEVKLNNTLNKLQTALNNDYNSTTPHAQSYLNDVGNALNYVGSLSNSVAKANNALHSAKIRLNTISANNQILDNDVKQLTDEFPHQKVVFKNKKTREVITEKGNGNSLAKNKEEVIYNLENGALGIDKKSINKQVSKIANHVSTINKIVSESMSTGVKDSAYKQLDAIYKKDIAKAEALNKISAKDNISNSTSANLATKAIQKAYNDLKNANQEVVNKTKALNSALSNLQKTMQFGSIKNASNKSTIDFAKAQQAVDSATKALKVAQADYTKANNALNSAVKANETANTNTYNQDVASADKLEKVKDIAIKGNANNTATTSLSDDLNKVNQASAKVASATTALNNTLKTLHSAVGTKGFAKAQQAVDSALNELKSAQAQYAHANNTLQSMIKTNVFNNTDKGIINVNNIGWKESTYKFNLENGTLSLGHNVIAQNEKKLAEKVDNSISIYEKDSIINKEQEAVAYQDSLNAKKVLNSVAQNADTLKSDNKLYQDNASNYQKATGIWSFNNAYSNVKDSAQVVTKDEKLLKDAINIVKNVSGAKAFAKAQQNEIQALKNLENAQQNFTNAQNAFNKVNDNFKNSMPFYASAWGDTSLINEYKQYANSSNATIKADYEKLSSDVYNLTGNTKTGVYRLSWWIGLNTYSAKNQQQVLIAQKALKDEEQQFTKDKTILTQAIAKAQQSALNQVSNLNNALNSDSKILNANLNRYNQATSVWGLKSVYNTTKADAQSVNKDKVALQQAMKSKNVVAQAKALNSLLNDEKSLSNAQNDLSQVLQDFKEAMPLYQQAHQDSSSVSAYSKYANSSNATIKADYEKLSSDVYNLTGNTKTGVYNLSWFMGNKVFEGLNGEKALKVQQDREQNSFHALENEEKEFANDKAILEHAIDKDYLKDTAISLDDNQDDIDYSDRMDD